MTSRRTWTRFAVLVVLLGFAAPAFAQIDTGVIVGRVVDDSGAVLPGVTVVATQDGTGVAATSVTNERGEFIFPGLRVGLYSVTAELQGFKRAVRREVRVSVQDEAGTPSSKSRAPPPTSSGTRLMLSRSTSSASRS